VLSLMTLEPLTLMSKGLTPGVDLGHAVNQAAVGQGAAGTELGGGLIFQKTSVNAPWFFCCGRKRWIQAYFPSFLVQA